MKIWFKLLLGIALGAAASIVVQRTQLDQELVRQASDICLRLGRLLVFPLVFFGLVSGTHELKAHGSFWRVQARTLTYLVLTSAALTLVGVLSVTIISPDRIPIIIQAAPATQISGLYSTLAGVLPTNLFRAFVGDGGSLLPVYVLAILLGRSIGFERNLTRVVVEFFNAFTRILYYMNSLATELLWVIVPILVGWTLTSLAQADLILYQQLLVILIIDVVIVYACLFPAMLYLLGVTNAPFKWLYAALGPALTGLISGDSFVSLSMLVRHGNESLGLPRMLTSAVYPVFAIFGRGGTAMVSGVAFILILKSYSSFEITILQILWVTLFAFLTSFVLGPVPGSGTVVSLALLCSLYGRGLQEGYLILTPVAPLLISLGVFIDVTTAAFVSLVIGKQEEMFQEVAMADMV